VAVESLCFFQQHQAESAMIGENDTTSFFGLENHMIVLAAATSILRHFVSKSAGPDVNPALMHGEATRHPHMDDQRLAAIEIE
jgi:hypothetical protein